MVISSSTKTTNYFMVFGSDRLKDLKYYLQQMNLPGISMSDINMKTKIRNQFIVGGDLEFDPITLKLLIDEDFSNYLALVDELKTYKDTVTGIINPKQFNSTMFITSNKGNPIIEFYFEDCMITNIDDQDFDDGSENDDVLSVNVTIKYSNLTYKKLT